MPGMWQVTLPTVPWVHGAESELSLVSRRTVCQYCMVDHRSSKRLKVHLYNVETYRRAYLGADLGASGEYVNGPHAAWQPPVSVEGPRPYWTSFQPEVLSHDAAVVFDARSLLRGILQAADEKLVEELLNPLYSKSSEFCPKRVSTLRWHWLRSKRFPYQLHTCNFPSILLSLLKDVANLLLVLPGLLWQPFMLAGRTSLMPFFAHAR